MSVGTVGVEEVQRLVSAGAQAVEVLPREEFDWAHLPGARLLRCGSSTSTRRTSWTGDGPWSPTATTSSET